MTMKKGCCCFFFFFFSSFFFVGGDFFGSLAWVVLVYSCASFGRATEPARHLCLCGCSSIAAFSSTLLNDDV